MLDVKTIWLTSPEEEPFKKLFKAYFSEFGMKMPDEGFVQMAKDKTAYGFEIILLHQADRPIGFCLFQIDDVSHPWCMHHGAGDIREFYIIPEKRKQGYGRHLFQITKQYFESHGVKAIYLSSDDQGAYWESLGFTFTGRIIDDNNSKEYRYPL